MEVRTLAHSSSRDRRFSLARYLPWAERKPLCTLASYHVYNSTACAYINLCGQFIHSSRTTPAIVCPQTILLLWYGLGARHRRGGKGGSSPPHFLPRGGGGGGGGGAEPPHFAPVHIICI